MKVQSKRARTARALAFISCVSLATQASAQAAAPDPVEADPVEAEPVEAEPVEAEPVAPERPEAKKQAPATPADETAPPEPAQEKKKTNKKPKQSKAGVPWLGFGSKNLGEVEVHGRIFARAAFSSRYVVTSESTGVSHEERVDSLDFSIPSARAELFYRAPFRWFSADIEVELADEPELRDAWLRAKNRHFAAKLGQFKAPFSAIELESRWNLPVASRGLLHDILVDELEVAGRRPGFTLGARTAGALDLSLTLGAFQGSVLVERDENGRDVDPLFEQGMRSQSLFVRTELSFDDLSLGLGYEHRVGTPDVLYIEHYPTFGADAVLDTRVLGRGLRIWLEGMVGGSWFEHARKPSDDRNAVFTAGRVVIAPRIGGNSRHAPYLEPYGMLGLFDPDTEVAQDLAFEESLGVNAGFWRLVRLGLEFELWRVQRNFPVSYGLGKNPDRLALLLQGGAEF